MSRKKQIDTEAKELKAAPDKQDKGLEMVERIKLEEKEKPNPCSDRRGP